MSAIIEFKGAKWQKMPLSMNDRRNRFDHAEQVKYVRRVGRTYAHNLIVRGQLETGLPVVVGLVWYVPDRIRRDEDNPTATLKALCDGLVDAGLVPDDTPEWMTKRTTRIVPRPGQPPAIELHIETRGEAIERSAKAFYAAMWPTGDWAREAESMRLKMIDSMREVVAQW